MSKHPKRPRDTNQLAKLVVDILTGQVEDREPDDSAGKNPAAVALGASAAPRAARQGLPSFRLSSGKQARGRPLSTSYVERQNLTLRMHMLSRFT
jgi:hypothetical protein